MRRDTARPLALHPDTGSHQLRAVEQQLMTHDPEPFEMRGQFARSAGRGDIKRVNRIVLQPKTWSGEDVFFARVCLELSWLASGLKIFARPMTWPIAFLLRRKTLASMTIRSRAQTVPATEVLTWPVRPATSDDAYHFTRGRGHGVYDC
jgi:hypothetical protein